MKPPVLVIGGPTASGKSAFAASLAAMHNGVVISADSISVYQGCNILSAKPPAEELSQTPYEMISCFSPAEQFDAAIFATRATSLISQAHQQQRLPIVCGGTGLYLRALFHGLVETPPVSESIREAVAQRERGFLEEGGDESRRLAMYHWLEELDPVRAGQLAPRDLVRIRRALYVALSSPQTLSELHRGQRHVAVPWRVLVIVLLPDRAVLYSRIDRRVDGMLQEGAIAEVQQLRERYGDDAPALKGIGYSHILRMLRGELVLEDAVESLKRDTRRLAKRQLTWWRNEPAKLGWIEQSGCLASDVQLRVTQFYTAVAEPAAAIEYFRVK